MVSVIAANPAIASQPESDEKQAFAFLLNRHGARAPQWNMDKKYFADDFAQFTVAHDNLTPSGMRQRYLKGRYNRTRFNELISQEYVPGEIYVQSTHFNRTKQSALSELMGLYPPGASGAEKMPASLRDGDLGPANPPFQVRDSESINAKLGQDALPNGFTAVPVMNVEASNPVNIRNEGCPIAYK